MSSNSKDIKIGIEQITTDRKILEKELKDKEEEMESFKSQIEEANLKLEGLQNSNFLQDDEMLKTTKFYESEIDLKSNQIQELEKMNSKNAAELKSTKKELSAIKRGIKNTAASDQTGETVSVE